MTPQKETAYRTALKTAIDAGYDILEKGGSALDAVETAVRTLEDIPLFNAGRGSVFGADGRHEMDASFMDGHHLIAGAVTMVEGVRNPISLARLVMDRSPHVMLGGRGAEQFARQHGLKFEDHDYFHDALRYEQWQKIKDTDAFQLDHTDLNQRLKGTVGAVALDDQGHLAAATSTGGMTNKKYGRIGDSPIIGVGNYANDKTCAVSCTGSGEYFMRAITAYDVSALMEYAGWDIHKASTEVIQNKLTAIGGDGGLIAIDYQGHIAMPFNSGGMYRACRSSSGHDEVAIYE
ncbi:UNVERIFIED_CONTAM: hypothetical protein GTU68_046621 [Idotea baltica]|nr:hypothetical protein [Idotea baltica]